VEHRIEATAAPITLPGPILLPWVSSLGRLVPLWRHALWLFMLFVVCAMSVAIRLDVQSLRKNLDRNDRLSREAQLLNQRLTLETDSRRRVAAVEAIASEMQLSSQVHVVDLRESHK
jgi:cell division protein FtsL